MDWYKIIKENYDKGIYTDDQVDVFVQKGKITNKQATQIKDGK